MNHSTVQTIGGDFRIYRIVNDINGNPRFLIHYLDLKLSDYSHTKITRKYFSKYRGRDFGGGFILSSYNVESTLNRYFEELKNGK